MQQDDYTYAVARIRFKETKLLSDADLDALLGAKDTDEVMRLLQDKGWGDSTDLSPDELLNLEEQKLWGFVSEIISDMSELAFLLVPNDFHNLKVAIKCITRDIKPDGLFLTNSVCDPDMVYEAIKSRDYNALPVFLQGAAQSAMTALLQTSDGQLCDIIVDKACMEYVYSLGKKSDNEIIRLYCELYVASADIKIAVRSANTRKKADFLRRAMAPCDTVDIEKLANASIDGHEAIMDYISGTQYRGAADAIESSMSAFEKWCDDYLTDVMKPQKWEPFSIGPIVAYIVARQNEMKAVRMILSGKVSHLSDETIKERLRSMYV